MLKDLQKAAAKAADHDEDDFRRAAAELLSGQFLFLDNARQRNHYRLVKAQLGYFTDLFDALGWSLKLDEDFGFVGLVPADGETQLPLKLDETLILLLLRLTFEEGLENHNTQRGCVSVDGEELLRRYETLLQRERPKRARFLDILKLFQRQNLLQRGDEDPVTALPQVRILPSIRVVAGEATLKRLEAYAAGDDLDVGHNDADEGTEEEA